MGLMEDFEGVGDEDVGCWDADNRYDILQIANIFEKLGVG